MIFSLEIILPLIFLNIQNTESRLSPSSGVTMEIDSSRYYYSKGLGFFKLGKLIESNENYSKAIKFDSTYFKRLLCVRL